MSEDKTVQHTDPRGYGPRRKRTLLTAAPVGSGTPHTVRLDEPLVWFGGRDLHLTDVTTASTLRFKSDELVAAVLDHVHPGAVLVTDLPEVTRTAMTGRMTAGGQIYADNQDPEILEAIARANLAVAREIRADRAEREAKYQAGVEEAKRRLKVVDDGDRAMAAHLYDSAHGEGSFAKLSEAAQGTHVSKARALRTSINANGGPFGARIKIKPPKGPLPF